MVDKIVELAKAYPKIAMIVGGVLAVLVGTTIYRLVLGIPLIG